MDTQKCEVFGAAYAGSDPIGAGTPAVFTIRARDKYGSRIPRGGAVFHAGARPQRHVRRGNDGAPRLASADEGDGTYTATYTPIKAGDYSLSVRRAGEELTIAGSPFNVTVVPGATSAARSKAYGDGLARVSGDDSDV